VCGFNVKERRAAFKKDLKKTHVTYTSNILIKYLGTDSKMAITTSIKQQQPCVVCHNTLSVSLFFKNGKDKHGEQKYVTTCKECWKQRYSLQARRDKSKEARLLPTKPEEELPRVRTTEDGTTMKRCTCCQLEKEQTLKNFFSNGIGAEGQQKYKTWCKACYKLKYPDRPWSVNKLPPEKRREIQAAWYTKNRDRVLAKAKERRRLKKAERERLKALEQGKEVADVC
jgi:RNase P subunit RPR2